MPEKTESEKQPSPEVMIQLVIQPNSGPKKIKNIYLGLREIPQMLNNHGQILSPNEILLIDGDGQTVITNLTYFQESFDDSFLDIPFIPSYMIFVDRSNNVVLRNLSENQPEEVIRPLVENERGVNLVEKIRKKLGKGEIRFRFLFNSKSVEAFTALQRLELN